jgi:hypothetical protein
VVFAARVLVVAKVLKVTEEEKRVKSEEVETCIW